MRLLLDTHAYIWWAFEPERLPAAVVEVLTVTEHDLSVSVASLWEMSIKLALGKLTLPVPLQTLAERLEVEDGVMILPVVAAHVYAHAGLQDVHRDPFDRMIVAQARAEGMTIVTRDPLIRQYAVPTLW